MSHRVSGYAAAVMVMVASLAGGLAVAPASAEGSTETDDTTPPQITILSPREGYVYFAGIELFPNPFGLTMTMGAFLFRPGAAMAVDNIDHPSEFHVTVLLDDRAGTTATYVPCDNTFIWQGSLGIGFGIYNLTVTARDTSGNTGSTHLRVFYDCILPPSS